MVHNYYTIGVGGVTPRRYATEVCETMMLCFRETTLKEEGIADFGQLVVPWWSSLWPAAILVPADVAWYSVLSQSEAYKSLLANTRGEPSPLADFANGDGREFEVLPPRATFPEDPLSQTMLKTDYSCMKAKESVSKRWKSSADSRPSRRSQISGEQKRNEQGS